MKVAKRGVERIKNVLLQDRSGAQDNFVSVIKSDVYDVLNDFFEVNPTSVFAEINVDEHGLYDITFHAKAFKVKGVVR